MYFIVLFLPPFFPPWSSVSTLLGVLREIYSASFRSGPAICGQQLPLRQKKASEAPKQKNVPQRTSNKACWTRYPHCLAETPIIDDLASLTGSPISVPSTATFQSAAATTFWSVSLPAPPLPLFLSSCLCYHIFCSPPPSFPTLLLLFRCLMTTAPSYFFLSFSYAHTFYFFICPLAPVLLSV